MADGCLKSRGRALTVLLFLALAGAAFAVDVQTEIDPGRLQIGESANLQVKISGAGNASPQTIPRVDGLGIAYSGMSRSFQWINGKTWSGLVLNFSVTPSRRGNFTIPPIVFTADGVRHQSQPVRLVVTQGAPGPAAGGRARLDGSVELSKNRVYTGEPIVMRYFLRYAGITLNGPRGISKLPDAKGFVQRQIEEQMDETSGRDQYGEFVRSHLVTFAMIPTMKGTSSIGGGSAGVNFSAADQNQFFSFPQSREVVFDTREVTVLPLPEAGKPADFSGNVGQFAMAVDYPKEPVKAFGEARISVRVRGKGNVLTMAEPTIAEIPGVRVLRGAGSASAGIEGGELAGEKEFLLTVIPERSGKIELGQITFNFFNPASARYETLKSEPISLFVTGDASGRARDLDFDREGEGFSVNWLIIALIVLAVVFAVAGVVYWEMRRYRETGNAPEPEAAPGGRPETARETYEALYRDIVLSLRGGETDTFLRMAEKTLNRVAEELSQSPRSPEIDAIGRLKERVYAVKYGAGKMSYEEAKELQNEIKSILTRLKGGS